MDESQIKQTLQSLGAPEWAIVAVTIFAAIVSAHLGPKLPWLGWLFEQLFAHPAAVARAKAADDAAAMQLVDPPQASSAKVGEMTMMIPARPVVPKPTNAPPPPTPPMAMWLLLPMLLFGLLAGCALHSDSTVRADGSQSSRFDLSLLDDSTLEVSKTKDAFTMRRGDAVSAQLGPIISQAVSAGVAAAVKAALPIPSGAAGDVAQPAAPADPGVAPPAPDRATALLQWLQTPAAQQLLQSLLRGPQAAPPATPSTPLPPISAPSPPPAATTPPTSPAPANPKPAGP